MKKWRYKKGDQTYGPFSTEEIIELLKKQEISQETQVNTMAFDGDWRKISGIFEITSIINFNADEELREGKEKFPDLSNFQGASDATSGLESSGGSETKGILQRIENKGESIKNSPRFRKCTNCGSQISVMVQGCPHCGANNSAQSRNFSDKQNIMMLSTGTESQWLYRKAGVEHGPVSLRELLSGIDSGDLEKKDLVWTRSFGSRWKEISECVELNDRSRTAARALIVKCPACSNGVSREAKSCPQCGHPLQEKKYEGGSQHRASESASDAGKKEKPEDNTSFFEAKNIILFVVLAVCGGLYFYYKNYIFDRVASDLVQRIETTLRTCSDEIGKSLVERALAGSPVGRVEGVSIIAWRETNNIRSTQDAVECSGRVILNSGREYRINYKFQMIDGRQLTTFDIPDYRRF